MKSGTSIEKSAMDFIEFSQQSTPTYLTLYEPILVYPVILPAFHLS